MHLSLVGEVKVSSNCGLKRREWFPCICCVEWYDKFPICVGVHAADVFVLDGVMTYYIESNQFLS